MNARLAVVIATWNSAGTIGECLASVRREAGADAEICVVDNASHDDSARIAERAGPGVEVIENSRNVGFAAAVNVGLARTVADRVLILNPDAVVESGAIAALNAAMSAPPAGERIAAVGPSYFDAQGRRRGAGAGRIPSLLDLLLRGLFLPQFVSLFLARVSAPPTVKRSVECLSGACLLVSRKAIDDVGGMDERYFLFYEDVEWCDRFRRAGYTLVFEPKSRVVHKGHVSVLQSPHESLKHEIESSRVFYTTRPRSHARAVVDGVWCCVSAYRVALYSAIALVPRYGRRYRTLPRAYWRLLWHSIKTFGGHHDHERALREPRRG